MYLTVLDLKYTKYEHQVQVLLNLNPKYKYIKVLVLGVKYVLPWCLIFLDSPSRCEIFPNHTFCCSFLN